MKKISLIVNFFSFKKMQNTVLEIEKRLKNSGFNTDLKVTDYPFHAYYIARDSVLNGSSLIVSLGGDGTINEVINGVLSIKEQELPEIGFIPLGTGVDFVKTVGISRKMEEALDTIINGDVIYSDVGRVVLNENEKVYTRYFINVLDAGLGGSVVRIARRLPKSLGGYPVFLISSLLGILTFKPFKVKIFIDDEFVDEGKITIIGAANGRYFGGGMHIAPMAKIDDGIFEFLYVKDTNIYTFIKEVLLPVYDANHLKYKKLYHFRGKKLKILGENHFLFEMDGEPLKAREIELSIVQNRIKLKIPRKNHY